MGNNKTYLENRVSSKEKEKNHPNTSKDHKGNENIPPKFTNFNGKPIK